ncbi:helix-turn-helix domain-containing protein [Candidatus Pacearchaeota archaeon]|jgi:DNA-binding IclR family transcriptional regulator|nr:helix-turn-helix domain-containing protein [Candidatus Pacearchaeota archaeon]
MSQQEILDVLRTHGPMGLHEIHTTINRAQSQTSKALTKLVELGEIVKGPDRIYRVMK